VKISEWPNLNVGRQVTSQMSVKEIDCTTNRVLISFYTYYPVRQPGKLLRNRDQVIELQSFIKLSKGK
jgi:hypothetical protein